jgi:hypothetical protein
MSSLRLQLPDTARSDRPGVGARRLAWCRQAPASQRRARDAWDADRAKRGRVPPVGWGGLWLAVAVLSWRTERARFARAERESLSGPYSERSERRERARDIPLSDRERTEGFRGRSGAMCEGGCPRTGPAMCQTSVTFSEHCCIQSISAAGGDCTSSGQRRLPRWGDGVWSASVTLCRCVPDTRYL